MTILPSELPSFDSFVKSTKASPRPSVLPERCPSCVASDRIPIYDVVDLHRHDSSHSMTSSLSLSPLRQEECHGISQDASSTTGESSSSSSYSSYSSGEDPEDCEMTDADSETSSSHQICPKTGKKKYLTEQQRYEIVCHVLSGEKQAHVAKQYGVTRAAVSYLVKHHNEIMHRVLTGHANYCCQRRAAAEAKLMVQA